MKSSTKKEVLGVLVLSFPAYLGTALTMITQNAVFVWYGLVATMATVTGLGLGFLLFNE